jgi:hypothetical protein
MELHGLTATKTSREAGRKQELLRLNPYRKISIVEKQKGGSLCGRLPPFYLQQEE